MTKYLLESITRTDYGESGTDDDGDGVEGHVAAGALVTEYDRGYDPPNEDTIRHNQVELQWRQITGALPSVEAVYTDR